MASFASSATTCGARKHATNIVFKCSSYFSCTTIILDKHLFFVKISCAAVIKIQLTETMASAFLVKFQSKSMTFSND